ncbi:MAG: hypothetical protein NTY15_01080 [Planctomycetota bacterium]|nr:hypothetical protein [Planctomycetota bacterium]
MQSVVNRVFIAIESQRDGIPRCSRGKPKSTIRLFMQSIRGQCRSFRALNRSGRGTWGFVRYANFTPGYQMTSLQD